MLYSAMEGSATDEPMVGRQGGPYVSVAAVCEKVLQEQDGALSLIRLVDRLTLGTAGPDTPDEMPPLAASFTLLLAMKSGGARGRYGIHLTMEAPSGERMPTELNLPLMLEGEERGTNIIIPVALTFEQEGLYWFDFYLADPHAPEQPEELLTRVPLRVLYQPQRLSAGPNS